MKYIILSLLFIFFSCSQLVQRRTPSSFDSLHLLNVEGARYILSYEPKRLGSFEELMKNEEKLFYHLQKVELGGFRGIHSRLRHPVEEFRDVISFNQGFPLSYEQWQELAPQITEAFAQGQRVFSFNGKFYSTWGVELTEKMIHPEVLRKALRYSEVKKEDLLMAFFKHQRALEVNEDMLILLPEIRPLLKRHTDLLIRDFKAQMGPFFEVSPLNLINSNHQRSPVQIEGRENYFAQKYQQFLNDEDSDESSRVCSTSFYIRYIGNRKIPREFLNTLSEHKERLMEVLNLTNNEYDELSALSLGILAVESKMGASFKYFIKEDLKVGEYNFGQIAISLAKRLKGRQDENSRGLTQIKDIGPLLKDTPYTYIEHADLDDPKHAAIATMFVLKEKLGYLKHFAKNHSNITSFNWADYLYYFYQGSSGQITKGLATPPLNLRIQKILEIRENLILFRDCH